MECMPERNPRIKFIRRDDGRGIVYIPQSGKIKILNATGTAILNLCDGKHSLKDIAAKIAEQFEETTEEIHNDIINYIELLKKEAILNE